MTFPERTQDLASIAFGGFLGAISRYAVSSSTISPNGTLIVNVVGSLLLGMMMYDYDYLCHISQRTRLTFGTGFMGAFTTFSTFAVETYDLGGNSAIFNIGINLALTLLAVFLGRGIIIYLFRRKGSAHGN
ncbi:camphor resistance protein CrcB [Methanococcoides methylutens]|uniref:Fluoride-specific ion channel FluC n=1 Tax=Methanococcoides methylutens TaxID=2226 RepID=A0A099SZV8_METMT|nr:fluoride efflux transporter CrcB [Methanococcoides methylutens]KGK98199.1 camphor resistance protein CrcB [Methanococcoides methylutens]